MFILQSQMDADCLCIQMLQYYGGSGADSNKLSILERFTHDTDNFYVWDLIAELESGRDPKLFPFYWGRWRTGAYKQPFYIPNDVEMKAL